MRRIKVCQVLNCYQVGGAETVALDLARSLDPSRFESLAVAVIEPASSGDEPPMRRRFREAGVPTHALEHRQFRDPRTLWDMVRFFRRERPDIIHGHNRFADLWAARCGRWAGVPHRIWTRHLVYQDMTPRQLARYRRLGASTPVVIAVSNAVAKHCVQTEGMAADRVRTVVNGIDTDRYRPLPATLRRTVRDRLGVAPDESMLLFVGRLTAQKDPEAFIALVGALRARGLAVRGFLCGRGDLAERLAARCTPTSGATLLGLRDDVPELLASCDLFVSTSRNEGLPLNVMEAMACGAAFIAPDLDQIAQLVAGSDDLAASLLPRHGDDGPPTDAAMAIWTDLAAARLAAGEQRRRCGEVGRNLIVERFSLSRMVRQHEAIYEELAAST